MEHSRMADTPPEPSDGNTSPDEPAGVALKETTPDAIPYAGQEAMHAINQRIFETSLDLIFIVDRQGTFIRVSPSSTSTLGYRPN
jgi:PAS domain-containing protein